MVPLTELAAQQSLVVLLVALKLAVQSSKRQRTKKHMRAKEKSLQLS
jgi:hypothetical protein